MLTGIYLHLLRNLGPPRNLGTYVRIYLQLESRVEYTLHTRICNCINQGIKEKKKKKKKMYFGRVAAGVKMEWSGVEWNGNIKCEMEGLSI